MTQKQAIQLFEERKVRTVWDDEAGKWYVSVVDVIGVLTDSPNPRKYWSVLKSRLKAEGSELATNCSQLKMQSADGKFYKTDAADTEQLFRLLQSIPSPNVCPATLRLWRADSLCTTPLLCFAAKRLLEALAVHDPFDQRGELPDKISDRPVLADVSAEINFHR